MKIINIHEAKTHLSRIVEEVASGEEYIIGKAGKPKALLIPYRQSRQPRQPGCWKGRVEIADDFDELPEEISKGFMGQSD